MNLSFSEGDTDMIEGTITLAENRRQYDTLGLYPRSYVDVYFLTESEKAEKARRAKLPVVAAQPPAAKLCARCKRTIQPRFTYCYRCYNYLQVKARIAKELAS